MTGITNIFYQKRFEQNKIIKKNYLTKKIHSLTNSTDNLREIGSSSRLGLNIGSYNINKFSYSMSLDVKGKFFTNIEPRV